MELLSTKEAAERLGTCEATVRNWCVDGMISAVKFGRNWKIRPDEVDHILQFGTREPDTDGGE